MSGLRIVEVESSGSTAGRSFSEIARLSVVVAFRWANTDAGPGR